MEVLLVRFEILVNLDIVFFFFLLQIEASCKLAEVYFDFNCSLAV